MKITDLQFLMDYNAWANGRILQAAAQVSPEAYTAPFPVSFGSLRGTLVHILGAEIVWRLRIQEGVSLSAMPGEGEFPTLADLSQRWADEERAMQIFLAGLEDTPSPLRAFEAQNAQSAEYGANRVVRYKTMRGIEKENVLWQLVAHVVNHGTQFRSEAGVILTQLGHSPGDLDMIYYIRSRE